MSHDKAPSMFEQRRRIEAAQWALELRDGEMSAERVTAWVEWSQAHLGDAIDTGNLAAFDQADALSLGLSALPSERKAALLQKFGAGERTRTPTVRPVGMRWGNWAYALAAGLLVAIGAGAWLSQRPADFTATYITNKAENRAFKLPDGTRLDLGAGTRMDIVYTAGQRSLSLREGEAYFSVEHDKHRPFVVRAGDLHITDIGTRFDIRKTGTQVVVTVAEGIVDVRKQAENSTSPLPVLRLTAGEQIRAGQAGVKLGDAPVARVDLATAASWRAGRLDFQDEALAEVIANVNRYAPHEIVIVDPEVARMRFTGTVFQNRTDDWLAATQHLFALRVEQSADGRVLLYAKE